MLPGQSSTTGTPSIRGTLPSPICVSSTPPVFKYLWWLSLKNIPSSSLTTWIKTPTNVWPRTGCIFTTMNSTKWLSWYGQTSNCLVVSITLWFSSNVFPVTAIQNMAHQHRELHLRLADAEKLRRYAQSSASKHQALEDGLGKAKGRSNH